MTESLLIINCLSLIPDSQRIIVMGGKRGWRDIVWPAMVSSIFMTLLGGGIGYFVGEQYAKSIYALFIVRAIAITLTIAPLLLRQLGLLEEDRAEYTPNTFQRNNIISPLVKLSMLTRKKLEQTPAATHKAGAAKFNQ